jgi:hypothetical protein
MATLNLDFGYFRGPQTQKLIGILGRHSADIPIRLWCYSGEFHPMDGLLLEYSIQSIEEIVGWSGEGGKCVDALVKVGFLDKVANGFALRDWNSQQGHLAAGKIRSRKMTEARYKKMRGENVDNSEPVKSIPPDNSSTSDSPSPSSSTSLGQHQALPMQGKAEQDIAFQYNALHGNNGTGINHSNDAYILHLSDEEFSRWCSRIQSIINRENDARLNNKFVWSIQGKNPVDDWKLLFNRFSEQDKRRLLDEAQKVLNGKLYWSHYVELGILVAVRRSLKVPIKNPIGFVYNLLNKPGSIVSDCVDGILKGYEIK